MNAIKKTSLVIRSAFVALALCATALTVASCTTNNPAPILILPTAPPTTPPTSPPNALVMSLGSVSFTVPGQVANFTASESGYTGTLTQTNNCAGIATVSPASATGPSGGFTVTAVAAGTCQVTIKDSNNQSGTLGVTVTTTSVTAS
jgi:hypothetical protein